MFGIRGPRADQLGFRKALLEECANAGCGDRICHAARGDLVAVAVPALAMSSSAIALGLAAESPGQMLTIPCVAPHLSTFRHFRNGFRKLSPGHRTNPGSYVDVSWKRTPSTTRHTGKRWKF